VAEVMGKEYLALPETMTVVDAGWSMIQAQRSTTLVLDDAKQLVGILSLADIKRHLLPTRTSIHPETLSPPILKTICTKEILFTYPEEWVRQASDRMVARGLQLLPVVEQAYPRQVLGVLEQQKVDKIADFASAQAALDAYYQSPATNIG
jgi:CBS domain-containing protein